MGYFSLIWVASARLRQLLAGKDGLMAKSDVVGVPTHGLRHVFATQMAAADSNPYRPARRMRHKSVNTSLRYINPVGDRAAQKSKQRRWVGWFDDLVDPGVLGEPHFKLQGGLSDGL